MDIVEVVLQGLVLALAARARALNMCGGNKGKYARASRTFQILAVRTKCIEIVRITSHNKCLQHPKNPSINTVRKSRFKFDHRRQPRLKVALVSGISSDFQCTHEDAVAALGDRSLVGKDRG